MVWAATFTPKHGNGPFTLLFETGAFSSGEGHRAVKCESTAVCCDPRNITVSFVLGAVPKAAL